MTLQSPPGYLQGGTYTALSDRLHLNTIRNHADFGAASFRAMQGFYPDRFPAYSNPSAMNWSVGPCAGVIANTFVSNGGEYVFANPTNVTGTFAASSPTQNRYDILGFRVRDNFYDSSGANEIIPAVIQGTNSSGTPVDPALPSSFIPILRAVINAGATTPVLQDLRPRTVPSAGILPVGSATARSALGTTHAGFLIWRTDTNTLESASGAGTWRILNIPTAADSTALGSAVTTPYRGQMAWRDDGNQHYFRDSDARWKPTRILAGRVLTGAGNQYTITDVNPETNMPKFQMTVDLVSGRWYRLSLALYLSGPGATPSSFAFRARRNTLGGTLLTEWLKRSEQDAGFDEDFHAHRLFQSAATESITLLLTGDVVAGAGDILVLGQGMSQWWIEDVGTDPNLLGVA